MTHMLSLLPKSRFEESGVEIPGGLAFLADYRPDAIAEASAGIEGLFMPPSPPRLDADLLARLARCREDDDAVEYLRSVVENEGGLTFAAEVMQGYITRAVEMLADYEDSEYRSALINLCAYIAERDR